MAPHKGFTLIEMIIYLFLFSIIIGGTLVTVYQIMQSTEKGSGHIIIQEEANFLLHKIDWALTDANSVAATSSTLSITKPEGKILFDIDAPNLRVTRGAGTPVILNTSNISVSNVIFAVSSETSTAVTARFTLTTNQSSQKISRDFSITKYLRK